MLLWGPTFLLASKVREILGLPVVAQTEISVAGASFVVSKRLNVGHPVVACESQLGGLSSNQQLG